MTEQKKAITQTINITDTAALKNVLKLNNSLNDNQLEEYIKLIQQKRKDELQAQLDAAGQK